MSIFALGHSSEWIIKEMKIQCRVRKTKMIWVKVFKNGASKICGRQPLKNLKWHDLLSSNFLKAVFHKFYLVHSWILCPIYLECFQTQDISKHANTPIESTLILETVALKWHFANFSVLQSFSCSDLVTKLIYLVYQNFSLWQSVLPL